MAHRAAQELSAKRSRIFAVGGAAHSERERLQWRARQPRICVVQVARNTSASKSANSCNGSSTTHRSRRRTRPRAAAAHALLIVGSMLNWTLWHRLMVLIVMIGISAPSAPLELERQLRHPKQFELIRCCSMSQGNVHLWHALRAPRIISLRNAVHDAHHDSEGSAGFTC